MSVPLSRRVFAKLGLGLPLFGALGLGWRTAFAASADTPSSWVLIPDDKRAAVWQVHADGKVARLDFSRLPMSPWAGATPQLLLQTSPRQDQVVYTFNNDLWLFDVPRSQHRRLTRVGQPYTEKLASVETRFLAWSLDGREVLYEVIGGETEAQGDGPTWAVKPRKADYGVKRLALASGASKAVAQPTPWNAHSRTWGADDRWYVTRSGPKGKPADDELHVDQLGSSRSERLIDERAGWGMPKLSCDGRWLVIHAGQPISQDTNTQRAPEMRAKLVRIELATRIASDHTPLGRWGEYNDDAISPNGSQVAYFRRRLSHPADASGSLMVNDRVLLESSGRVEPYWINEERLAFMQMRTPQEGGPRIGVWDLASNKLSGSFDLPASR